MPGTRAEPRPSTEPQPRRRARRGTRTGTAWVGICIGALVCAALIIFMLQNTDPVEVTFLGMSGTAPLALTLLIAGVGVGGIALVIGSLRIGQLRRRIAAERAATVQATDRAAARATDRATDRSADRPADRGPERAADRSADRLADRGPDRAADRSADRATPPAGPSVP